MHASQQVVHTEIGHENGEERQRHVQAERPV